MPLRFDFEKLHDELANDVYQTMALETQDLSTTK
jgi:hypothetical protein